MSVYLDLVVLLNFLVDLLLLAGTQRLAGHQPNLPRLLGAAAIGGVYGGVCLLPRLRFLGGTAWRLTALAGMAGVAFGTGRESVKQGCLFVLLSFALGGMALSMSGRGLPALLLGLSGLWLISAAGFGGKVSGQEYVAVTLRYAGKTVAVTALRDTGNTLRDPVTGEPVLILSARAAEKLTGLTAQQLGNPMSTLASGVLPGLRLIPYRAVGVRGGMLLGLRLENCVIGQKHCACVVAFAPEGLDEQKGYQALTGGVI